MREILFRGKRLDNGEWVYGVPVPFEINCYNKGQIEMVRLHSYDELDNYHLISDDEEVIPSTIGQYTGIEDKNGQKIFEGDIVQIITANIDEEEPPFVVKYDSQKAQFVGKNNECTYEYNEGFSTWEVVGNIYDNPELLSEITLQED